MEIRSLTLDRIEADRILASSNEDAGKEFKEKLTEMFPVKKILDRDYEKY